jgi:hypothetical protein
MLQPYPSTSLPMNSACSNQSPTPYFFFPVHQLFFYDLPPSPLEFSLENRFPLNLCLSIVCTTTILSSFHHFPFSSSPIQYRVSPVTHTLSLEWTPSNFSNLLALISVPHKSPHLSRNSVDLVHSCIAQPFLWIRELIPRTWSTTPSSTAAALTSLNPTQWWKYKSKCIYTCFCRFNLKFCFYTSIAICNYFFSALAYSNSFSILDIFFK